MILLYCIKYTYTLYAYLHHHCHTRICQVLHFFISSQDVSVVFISCLVSVGLCLHCDLFPWILSFFLSILEFFIVVLLLWLSYCLIRLLRVDESETHHLGSAERWLVSINCPQILTLAKSAGCKFMIFVLSEPLIGFLSLNH